MSTLRHNKQKFFKYYTTESTKITLKTTSLKWSSPLLFNDPFDNQFELRYKEPDDSLVASQLKQFLEIITSPEPLRPNQFGPKTAIMEFIRQVHMQNPDIEYTENHLTYLRGGVIEGIERVTAYMPEANAEIRRVMADTSVFCLSETHDNLPMWSHYAQNHTGAVIEFRVLPEVDSPTLVAKPVRYSKEMPRLNFADLADFEKLCHEIVEIITLTKSDVWAYEKEWRIVSGLRDNIKSYEILPCHPEEIGEVYIGCKMTDADKAEVIEITHSKYEHAKVFQAQKHPREFALIFEEVV